MVESQSSQPRPPKPLLMIFLGAFVAFLGVCFFQLMDRLEKGASESHSVPSAFMLLYRIGGKWFAAGVVVLVGLLLVAAGIAALARKFSRK